MGDTNRSRAVLVMAIPVGPVYAVLLALVLGYWLGLYVLLSCSPFDPVDLPGDED